MLIAGGGGGGGGGQQKDHVVFLRKEKIKKLYLYSVKIFTEKKSFRHAAVGSRRGGELR